MEIDPKQLPNDPAALRQMVVGLLEEAVERERKLRQLQHWVEQLLRARYGPRRERVDEHQLFLFAAAILAQGGKTPPASEEGKAPPSGSTSSSRQGMAGERCQNPCGASAGFTILRKRSASVRSAGTG